jgi:hypothetical protein
MTLALLVLVAASAVATPAEKPGNILVLDGRNLYLGSIEGGPFPSDEARDSAGVVLFERVHTDWVTRDGAGGGKDSVSVHSYEASSFEAGAHHAARGDCAEPSWVAKAKVVRRLKDDLAALATHELANEPGAAGFREKGSQRFGVSIPAGFARVDDASTTAELEELSRAELAKASGVPASPEPAKRQASLSAKFARESEALWYVSSESDSDGFITVYFRAGARKPKRRLASFDFVISCP